MGTSTCDPLVRRHDFPFLDRTVNGHPWIYLDSAATSQKPLTVLDAEREFAEHYTSAVHRGAHTPAGEATELFERARETVAQFIGANNDEVVWTSGATGTINLIAYALSNASLGRGGDDAAALRISPGDDIVVTRAEHHANLIPWQECAARIGATLTVIDLDDDGCLQLDDAQKKIGQRTKVVAFTHVSNVIGVVSPVAELVDLAHRVGAVTVLDACQSVPHLPVNVHELGVDFAAFSGHKMLGPTGVGVLYGRSALLNALPPFFTGGSMITSVTAERAEYLPAPHRFEAGTQPVSQAYALARACDYLTTLRMTDVADHEAALAQRLVTGIGEIPGVRLLGPGSAHARIGLASFVVDGVHAHDVGQFLDDRGISVRVGHHCAQPLHRHLGITASTRISTYIYTSAQEIDAALSALADVRHFFGASTR